MDADIQTQLEEWGFNGMRIPMMWSGVSLAEDEFDQDYLDTMKTVVNELYDHGIYSLLDMHQDVLSSTLGEYDGAPQWVTNQTVRRHEYPWPLTEPLKAWGLGYLAEATCQSFQEIYDNTHGGRDAWGATWKEIASNFKDLDGVLGYELLNEPWAGDIYQTPELMFPGLAGSRNLQPAYTAVAEAIREADEKTIIFFEPVTWGMIFPGDGSGHNVTSNQWASSGFTQVPGGDDYKNRSVLSYHYYCWFYEENNDPLPPLMKDLCDVAFGPKVFETVHEDIEKIGGGSMLTEFGAVNPDINYPDGANTDQIVFVLNECDKYFQSWSYWDMSSLYNKDTGGWDMDAMFVGFIRTYPQAIAGEPTSISFDFNTSAFEFTYVADATIMMPTEIAVPAVLYPDGFNVVLSDDGVLSWQMSESRPNVIELTASVSGTASISIAKS
jgi:endoglycosylceramidase